MLLSPDQLKGHDYYNLCMLQTLKSKVVVPPREERALRPEVSLPNGWKWADACAASRCSQEE